MMCSTDSLSCSIPLGRYDVMLNLFFTAELFAEPRNTQLAVAHDLKRFLTFLWESRGERSWRDASGDPLNWVRLRLFRRGTTGWRQKSVNLFRGGFGVVRSAS
jgi:hypothetical protein